VLLKCLTIGKDLSFFSEIPFFLERRFKPTKIRRMENAARTRLRHQAIIAALSDRCLLML